MLWAPGGSIAQGFLKTEADREHKENPHVALKQTLIELYNLALLESKGQNKTD